MVGWRTMRMPAPRSGSVRMDLDPNTFWAWVSGAPPAFFFGVLVGSSAYAWAVTLAKVKRNRARKADSDNRVSPDERRRIEKEVRRAIKGLDQRG
jgi:hypothetical protein